jgi:hypothetical protein
MELTAKKLRLASWGHPAIHIVISLGRNVQPTAMVNFLHSVPFFVACRIFTLHWFALASRQIYHLSLQASWYLIFLRNDSPLQEYLTIKSLVINILHGKIGIQQYC